ncbi:hypothetical protein [Polyangium sp. 6x1]|uniref:hypothetical protein n=1 Tax=Polyangium sp. 6x1 TaxID=3042689 RepID=UPI0024821489|nr:hypothetical protein [Polyangium sp. 6x1]MDI1448485.1 hypothetical protein [Polyangium sp. 6x1]
MDPLDRSIQTWDVGANSIRLERPDLVHVVFRGPNKLQDVLAIQRILFVVGDRFGSFDLLLGLGELEALGAGAREAWARVDRTYPFRNGFAYGASFAIRTLVHTTHRAGRLISPAFFRWNLSFFPTEAAARAHIDAQRIRAEGLPSPV